MNPKPYIHGLSICITNGLKNKSVKAYRAVSVAMLQPRAGETYYTCEPMCEGCHRNFFMT